MNSRDTLQTLALKPLIETLSPSESNMIVERSDSTVNGQGKSLWLKGVFMQSEIKNRNGRRYPLQEISRAVDNAMTYIKEAGGIFGELDHPQTLTINMDRVSHVITELKMFNNNAIGKAKLLSTPVGNIAKVLIDESGVRIGVSSRGAGELINEEVNKFHFVTADIVAVPSAPGALPESIYESLEMNAHGKQVLTLAEQIQHDQAAQKYFQKQITKFLSDMKWQKQK